MFYLFSFVVLGTFLFDFVLPMMIVVLLHDHLVFGPVPPNLMMAAHSVRDGSVVSAHVVPPSTAASISASAAEHLQDDLAESSSAKDIDEKVHRGIYGQEEVRSVDNQLDGPITLTGTVSPVQLQ